MHREQADYLHLRVGRFRIIKAHYHQTQFSKHTHEGYCIGVIEEGAQSFLGRVNYMLLLKVTLFWLMQMKFTQAHLLLNRAGVTVQSILHPKCLLK